MRTVIGGFLIAHGLMHGAVWITKPNPRKRTPAFSDSWLLGPTRTFSVIVAVVVGIALVSAGVA